MAVHRLTPTCPYCGEEIAIAERNEYKGIPRLDIPYGDNFIGWKFIKHNCKKKPKIK